MHGLLERIDRQKPQSGLHRFFAHSGPLLLLQELAQAIDCQGIEPPALADEPFLEGALLKIKTVQELAPVQHEGAGQYRRISAAYGLFELAHVDSDIGRL